jgi:hypothetical protein
MILEAVLRYISFMEICKEPHTWLRGAVGRGWGGESVFISSELQVNLGKVVLSREAEARLDGATGSQSV